MAKNGNSTKSVGFQPKEKAEAKAPATDKPAVGFDPEKKQVLALSKGGDIKGKGTGTSDQVPIMASNGEFMIKAAAVKKIGIEALEALNAIADGPDEKDSPAEKRAEYAAPRGMKCGGAVKKMAKGGLVDENGQLKLPGDTLPEVMANSPQERMGPQANSPEVQAPSVKTVAAGDIPFKSDAAAMIKATRVFDNGITGVTGVKPEVPASVADPENRQLALPGESLSKVMANSPQQLMGTQSRAPAPVPAPAPAAPAGNTAAAGDIPFKSGVAAMFRDTRSADQSIKGVVGFPKQDQAPAAAPVVAAPQLEKTPPAPPAPPAPSAPSAIPSPTPATATPAPVEDKDGYLAGESTMARAGRRFSGLGNSIVSGFKSMAQSTNLGEPNSAGLPTRPLAPPAAAPVTASPAAVVTPAPGAAASKPAAAIPAPVVAPVAAAVAAPVAANPNQVIATKQANGVMSFSGGPNIGKDGGDVSYGGSAGFSPGGGNRVSTVPGMSQATIDQTLNNPNGGKWSAADNAIMAANIRDGVNPNAGTSRDTSNPNIVIPDTGGYGILDKGYSERRAASMPLGSSMSTKAQKAAALKTLDNLDARDMKAAETAGQNSRNSVNDATARRGQDVQAKSANAQNDLAKQKLGMDQTRLGMEQSTAGFASRSAKRIEDLQTAYEKAKPEDKAGIAEQLRVMTGKDKPANWKSSVLQGSTDSMGNKTEGVLAAVNEQTGEIKRYDQGRTQAKSQPHPEGTQLTKDGKNYVVKNGVPVPL